MYPNKYIQQLFKYNIKGLPICVLTRHFNLNIILDSTDKNMIILILMSSARYHQVKMVHIVYIHTIYCYQIDIDTVLFVDLPPRAFALSQDRRITCLAFIGNEAISFSTYIIRTSFYNHFPRLKRGSWESLVKYC